METSAQRLYEAARVLRDVVGQTNVARLLNESPQTVKNWESRGVSDADAHLGGVWIGRLVGLLDQVRQRKQRWRQLAHVHAVLRQSRAIEADREVNGCRHRPNCARSATSRAYLGFARGGENQRPVDTRINIACNLFSPTPPISPPGDVGLGERTAA